MILSLHRDIVVRRKAAMIPDVQRFDTVVREQSLCIQKGNNLAPEQKLEKRRPLITVITPSYQQGQFIERTLRSVLEQGYPRLQYLVVDGGSTDDTLGILERYKKLYPESFWYVSESDRGQAHALNKGLALARGKIIGWLNSDDTYSAGSLLAIAAAFEEQPKCGVIYGHGRYISEEDDDLGAYATRRDCNLLTLADDCPICQPTLFWLRSLAERGIGLDETLQYCMDYDLWIRLSRETRFGFVDRLLACSRMYPANKTSRCRAAVLDEIIDVVKRHYGYLPHSWALGRASYRVEGGEEIDRPPVSRRVRAVAELYLLRHNWSRADFWSHRIRHLLAFIKKLSPWLN